MEDWDAQMMLDKYVHDYLVRRNMHTTAEIFAEEANVSLNPVAIDSPEGFLTEWWSFFWDIYSAKLQRQPEATEDSSFKVTQIAGDVSQIIRPMPPRLYMNCMLQNVCPAMLMQGLPNLPQTVHSTVTTRPDMESLLQNTLPTIITRPELNPKPPSILDFNIGKEQTLTNLITARVHEQDCNRLPARNLNFNSPLLNVDQFARLPARDLNFNSPLLNVDQFARLPARDLNFNSPLLNVDQFARLPARDLNFNSPLLNVDQFARLPARDLNFNSPLLNVDQLARLPARDLNFNSPLLNVDQLARMLPSASKPRHPKKKVSKKPQRPFFRTGNYRTDVLGSTATEPMPHVASNANQRKTEPVDTGSSTSSNSASSGPAPESKN